MLDGAARRTSHPRAVIGQDRPGYLSGVPYLRVPHCEVHWQRSDALCRVCDQPPRARRMPTGLQSTLIIDVEHPGSVGQQG